MNGTIYFLLWIEASGCFFLSSDCELASATTPCSLFLPPGLRSGAARRDRFAWHQSLGSLCPAHQHQPRAEQGAGSCCSSALSFKWGLKPWVGSWPRSPLPPQRGSWAGSVCLPIPVAPTHGLGIQLVIVREQVNQGFYREYSVLSHSLSSCLLLSATADW